MSFVQKLLYYCLLCGTTVLSIFYIYEAVFKRSLEDIPPYIKESFGLASLFILAIQYKAYQLGELQERYTTGIVVIISSWLIWGLVLLAYVILAKTQGRF